MPAFNETVTFGALDEHTPQVRVVVVNDVFLCIVRRHGRLILYEHAEQARTHSEVNPVAVVANGR